MTGTLICVIKKRLESEVSQEQSHGSMLGVCVLFCEFHAAPQSQPQHEIFEEWPGCMHREKGSKGPSYFDQ